MRDAGGGGCVKVRFARNDGRERYNNRKLRLGNKTKQTVIYTASFPADQTCDAVGESEKNVTRCYY